MRWLGQPRPISLTLILGKRVEKLMQAAINGRIKAWEYKFMPVNVVEKKWVLSNQPDFILS